MVISIVIPVYNLKPVLDRCINSVLNQTYSGWQLILVDDGSNDGSELICDNYAQMDSRVTVIHQQNTGAGGARNTGIEEAIGRGADYIVFIDGDDWWDTSFIEKMYSRIAADGTLLVACGFIRIEEDGTVSETSIVPEHPAIWDSKECYKNAAVIGTGPTRKLIAASLLADLRFPLGKLYEDEFFTYKLIYLAGKVSILNEHLYYYYQRSGSLMHSPITAKGIGDKLEALYEKELFFAEHGEDELAIEAKETALVANAKAVILAIQAGRYSKKEFPKQYRLSKLKALSIIHKYCSDDNFSYFLKKVYPNGPLVYSYLKKIRSMLSLRNNKSTEC